MVRWWCCHDYRLLKSVLLVMSMGVDVYMFNDELTRVLHKVHCPHLTSYQLLCGWPAQCFGVCEALVTVQYNTGSCPGGCNQHKKVIRAVFVPFVGGAYCVEWLFHCSLSSRRVLSFECDMQN